jgi:hypothetical protein
MSRAVQKAKVTEARISRALVDCMGYLPDAAKDLGMAVTTLRLHISRNEKLYRLHQELTAKLVNVAETHLFDMVASGDWPAIKFALERLSREKYGPAPVAVLQLDNNPAPIGEEPPHA